MSTIPEISVHPQQAVHAFSLLSSPSAPVTHHQTKSAANSQGSEDAQNFWLAAAKGITWSKPPTVAYGLQGTNSKVSELSSLRRFKLTWRPIAGYLVP